MAPEPKGWELFNASFKIGDEVVVVCTDDTFHWGELTFVGERDLTLTRTLGKHDTLGIDDIRFMAHDGFPVRKVLGADGSLTIERLDTEGTQRFIREAFETECSAISEAHKVEQWLGKQRARFGDPFDLEAAGGRIYHAGNSGPGYWSRFWNELTGYHSEDHREFGYETEEVLVMDSGDGAKAHLWDLTTVYAFEVSS